MTQVGDVEGKIAAANQLLDGTGPRPEIEPPADGSVTLARGVHTDDGWQNEAVVRELRGTDEEIITRFDMEKHTTPELTDLVLSRGVESLGNIDAGHLKEALKRLCVGDRDHLLLAIAVATYGDERFYPSVLCPGCGEKNDVTVSIAEDIPIRVPADAQEESYEFTLRDGSVATFRLIDGTDQIAASKIKSSLAEVNTLLLGRTVLAVDGKPVSNGQKWSRELGLADRRKLVSWMADLQPGPQVGTVDITCVECGKEAPLALSWTELLPFQ